MLLGGFPSAASSITQATVSAYLDAVIDYPVDAIQAAYQDYRDKKVPDHANWGFPPTAPQFGDRARLHTEVMAIRARRAAGADSQIVAYPIGQEPPPGAVPLGPLSIDYGNGAIDMSWMTPEEKRRVLISNGKDIPTREESRALVA